MPVYVFVWLSLAVQAEPLVVDDAYFYLPVPGQDISAAYMTIRNVSSEPVVFSGYAASGVRAVELHQHSSQNGVMRMRRIDYFKLSGGERIELAPGGYHFMLFGLDASLGAESTLRFTIEHSGDQTEFIIPARDIRQSGT